MKLVKMSLAAAVLLGASAFAIDNVKVSGDAKLFYSTNNNGANAEMFDGTAESAGQSALRLGATADLTKGISGGATLNAISTLGLENNLVGAVWESGLNDQYWFSEAWLAATMGKTTVKVGRMELDTPLAFTEKWSIVPNTFEAAVAINQDIPDTTLVAAYVGKDNGSHGGTGVGYAGVVNAAAITNGFQNFYSGAYAFAAVNNSFKPLTVQAWYYDVLTVANAYWLQADVKCQLVPGATIGAQYAKVDLDGANGETGAYAVKLGYEGVKNLKVSAAYSKTEDEAGLNIANIATNTQASLSQSKLYTEAWWNYGFVSAQDVESFNVTAEYDAGIAKLGAYYTNADQGLVAGDADLKEFAVTAGSTFGPLDVTVAYFNTDVNGADSYDTIQAYLTLNF